MKNKSVEILEKYIDSQKKYAKNIIPTSIK